jgi:hypothetical protein
MDEHLIDKRVIQKHITKGKVDAKAYDRLLAALPDLSDRVARSSIGAAAARVEEPVTNDAADDTDDDADDDDDDSED